MGLSLSPGIVKDESSDEKDGGCTPSRICACVKGDKPRLKLALDPFFRRFWWLCSDAVDAGDVLPRRGRPPDRDGGLSSVSTGVVLRDGVRECDSERVLRRAGDLGSRACLETFECWWW